MFNSSLIDNLRWKFILGQDGNYQVIMKEVELDLVGFNDCEAKFRETRLGNKFDLHKSFICAGGQENQDTCKGEI